MTININSKKIAIVCDSAGSLASKYRTGQYDGITEVPFSIIISSKADGYIKEWVDHPFVSEAERAEFIQDLDLSRNTITTSQPNLKAYRDIFETIIKTGVTEIGVIPMSSQLSGSIESAQMAAAELSNLANIVVANPRTTSIGQGLLISQADIENKNGNFKNASELVNRVEKLSKNVCVVQAFSDLDHLRKGGRIGLATGMLAGVLDIKPLISINAEGLLVPIEKKPRGWRNANEAIVNYVVGQVGSRAVRLAFVYFGSDQLDNLKQVANDRFVMAKNNNGEEYEILECEQSKVLGAHSGSGVIGLGALVLDN